MGLSRLLRLPATACACGWASSAAVESISDSWRCRNRECATRRVSATFPAAEKGWNRWPDSRKQPEGVDRLLHGHLSQPVLHRGPATGTGAPPVRHSRASRPLAKSGDQRICARLDWRRPGWPFDRVYDRGVGGIRVESAQSSPMSLPDEPTVMRSASDQLGLPRSHGLRLRNASIDRVHTGTRRAECRLP